MKNFFSNAKDENKTPVSSVNITKISALTAGYYLMAIAAVSVLSYFFGGVLTFFMGAVFSTALFAVIVSKADAHIARTFTIIFFVVFILMTGSVSTAVVYLMMFLPGGIAFGLSAKNKAFFNSAMSFAFLLLIGFFGAFVLIFTIENTSPISFKSTLNLFSTYFQDSFATVYDAFKPLVVSSFANMPKSDFVIRMYAQFVLSLPAIFSLAVLFAYSFSYWFFKFLYLRNEKRENRKNFYFFGKFMYVRLSTTAAYVYMISMLISFFSPQNEDFMYFHNFSLIFPYLFAYSGIALIDYFVFLKYGLSQVLRTIICILLFVISVLPSGFITFISLLGLADSFYHLRRFIRPKEDMRYL